MAKLFNYFLLLFIIGAAGCKTASVKGDDGKLEVVFVQVNDVYEIAPLSAGREGGVARIATLKKQLKKKNPNTFLVMAGDFLSPSIYFSLRYNNVPVRGKQMVESLNAAGLDLAVFGNHEFDILEGQLQQRMDESSFDWISGNAFQKTNTGLQPFKKNGVPLKGTKTLSLVDGDGTRIKLGIISAILPFNRAEYVGYTDALSTAKKLYNEIKDSVDAVIALTHQSEDDDKRLAREIPDLYLIMGGHEHDNRFLKEGNILITKAHANAKSAYVLKLDIDKKKKKSSVSPELVYLNQDIPLDLATDAVVKKWTSIAEKNFSTLGFDASKIILEKKPVLELDGRETEVRRTSTGLTQVIVKGIETAAPQSEVSIMNGGSIRVDDVLQVPLTEYDIIRSLPFGGSIREVEMKGSFLKQVMDQGRKNIGTGGYLHFNDYVQLHNGQWLIKGSPLDPARIYRVAITDFLLTGKEMNLEYLNPENLGIVKVYEAAKSREDPRSDIRLAVIRYLEKLNSGK
jgi:2',3'-cyclic-nucleotide 2'-phosphodiesterase (5'-nucleotidase family)